MICQKQFDTKLLLKTYLQCELDDLAGAAILRVVSRFTGGLLFTRSDVAVRNVDSSASQIYVRVKSTQVGVVQYPT